MRMHFPDVPLLARARNRTHLMRLREMGVREVMRETWWSSVELGKLALKTVRPELDADRFAALFAAHDARLLERQQAVYHDQAALIALSKTASAELEDILQGDAQLREHQTLAADDAPAPTTLAG
jgi:voltage-gated potassium channel Kch